MEIKGNEAHFDSEELVKVELDDRDILGRDFNSLTHSVKDEEGYWRVIVTITDKILYKGSDSWIEENVEAMSVDRDFHKAVETAMKSSLGYIVENVYQKGFPGLVEFREFERKVKELSEAAAKNIQNT